MSSAPFKLQQNKSHRILPYDFCQVHSQFKLAHQKLQNSKWNKQNTDPVLSEFFQNSNSKKANLCRGQFKTKVPLEKYFCLQNS